MRLECSRQFSKNPQTSNVMTMSLVGADLFQAEGRTKGPSAGQTDMTRLIVAIRNFANAPKKNLR